MVIVVNQSRTKHGIVRYSSNAAAMKDINNNRNTPKANSMTGCFPAYKQHARAEKGAKKRGKDH